MATKATVNPLQRDRNTKYFTVVTENHKIHVSLHTAQHKLRL